MVLTVFANTRKSTEWLYPSRLCSLAVRWLSVSCCSTEQFFKLVCLLCLPQVPESRSGQRQRLQPGLRGLPAEASVRVGREDLPVPLRVPARQVQRPPVRDRVPGELQR
jgi:hypothetical protein